MGSSGTLYSDKPELIIVNLVVHLILMTLDTLDIYMCTNLLYIIVGDSRHIYIYMCTNILSQFIYYIHIIATLNELNYGKPPFYHKRCFFYQATGGRRARVPLSLALGRHDVIPWRRRMAIERWMFCTRW